MAVVGHRHSSRQMMAYHGPAAAASHPHAILAAAHTSSVPFYTGPVVTQQQPAATPAHTGGDVQPDRPIGYGAFGVVW